MSNLERRTLEGVGRVYFDPDEEVWLPSVTTVIDVQDEPAALKAWKRKYDGTGDTKHWRDILMFKSNRGTLIHYHLLDDLTNEEMYGHNEENAEQRMKEEGDWQRYKKNLYWAQNAWDAIKEKRGITEDLSRVETYVNNTDIGYAGQFDLLYVDCDGNVVLSDLKTSKGIYEKHKLQLVAYENALPFDVDLLEVIRIHPDTETFAISHSDEWSEDRDELLEKFISLREELDIDLQQIREEGADDGN